MIEHDTWVRISRLLTELIEWFAARMLRLLADKWEGEAADAVVVAVLRYLDDARLLCAATASIDPDAAHPPDMPVPRVPLGQSPSSAGSRYLASVLDAGEPPPAEPPPDGAPGMGAMYPPAARGRGDDDAEHATAGYLVTADHCNGLIGNLPRVAPPVIQ